MRPRLVLGLEKEITRNINDPAYVYEALKVYLMLGHKAPLIDNTARTSSEADTVLAVMGSSKYMTLITRR